MEKIQRQSSILRQWMVCRRRLTGKMIGLKGTGGSVFIGLIITMVVIAGLGAAMLPLSNTSTRSQITGNQAQAGYYLAESGMRYIASEFRHSADGLTTVCAAEDARDNILKANHSQAFTVNDGGAYFDLDIVPYYFEVHTDEDVSPDLKAAVFGGIPSEIPTDKPGYLQIVIKNDECTLLSARHDYHYTSVSTSGDDILFNGITLDGGTPAGPAISTQNDRIFPACKSAGDGGGGDQTVIKDGDLTFQADTGADIFPGTACRFKINGTGNTYKYQELDLDNNMLKGITNKDDPDAAFTLTLRDTDYVVIQRFIKLTSRGSASASSATASAAIAFNLSVEDSGEEDAQGVPYGLFGNTLVEVKNSGQVKSYNSTTDPNPSSSTGEGDICSNEQVTLRNSAYVDGNVVIGKDASGNQGTYTTQGTPTVTGNAPVNVDRVNPDPFGAIGGTLATAFTTYSASNDNGLAVPPISGNVISLSSGGGGGGGGRGRGGGGGGGGTSAMTLVGKEGGANYYVTGITLNNSCILNIDATNGPVNIYLAGKLEAKNGSQINVTGNPPDFIIYCNYSSQHTEINLKNSSDFKGAVYAPYGDILVHNSGTAYGMFWGKTIDIRNSGVVWFDTALRETVVFAGSGGGSQSLVQ